MGLGQGVVKPGQRLLARVAMHDQLGHHRVIEGADCVALAHAVVEAQRGDVETVVRGLAVVVEPAGGGQELALGVFSADAGLNRVTLDLQLVLAQRQRLAGGNAQLPLDQVQPGDGLGHRVLDLQPGIHLHEEEIHVAAGALLDDELDRAGTDVIHRARGRDRRQAHLRAQLRRQPGRRRFLQHLLVPALHRAVALEQVDDVAVRIAKDLDLDMARALDIFLDQHRVVAKAVARLALAGGQRGSEILAAVHCAHALAATARAGLDQDGVADAVGLGLQQRRVLVGAVIARHQRHAGAFHQLLGLGLQAHVLDRRGWRADENQAGIGAGLGEFLVLAQKAVAGVDRLRASRLGGCQDGWPAQIAVLGRAAADVNGLVAGGDMLGAGVGVRIDRDGLDAEAMRGSGNAAGDFATVGNQDFLEHGLFPQASQEGWRFCRKD